MNLQRHGLLVMTVAAVATAASWQQASAAGSVDKETNAASVPDFSGVWRRGGLPWYEPPASGPGPITNRSRRNDVSNYDQLVGDYTNPILQPWAAEIVKRYGQISLAGVTFPSPSNQCWPEPVPYIFKHMGLAVLQQPHQITLLFNEDHEVRQVPIGRPHPAQVTPSWHGDSVAHWEGSTLVIDTVGVKTDRPYPMIDLFGTPYTKSLHVVERYSLLDRERAKDALERGLKENQQQGPLDKDYAGGKYLQVHLTVEDEGAFTAPWTATMTYIIDSNDWREIVCAENRHEYYYGKEKESDVPRADRPDF